jgi:hypothetical protein
MRSAREIARFCTVLANTFPKDHGSDLALKPRRINRAVQMAANMATMSSKRRNILQTFCWFLSFHFRSHPLRLAAR